MLAGDWSAVEIQIVFFGADFFYPAFDAHLTFQLRPKSL
ncbi:hypothetical protein AAKU67_002090 [Oxalobacteraceae bacterium GrIS 2.11]